MSPAPNEILIAKICVSRSVCIVRVYVLICDFIFFLMPVFTYPPIEDTIT